MCIFVERKTTKLYIYYINYTKKEIWNDNR